MISVIRIYVVNLITEINKQKCKLFSLSLEKIIILNEAVKIYPMIDYSDKVDNERV